MMEDVNKNPKNENINDKIVSAFSSDKKHEGLTEKEVKLRQTMTSVNNRPKKGPPSTVGKREYTGPDLSGLHKPPDSDKE